MGTRFLSRLLLVVAGTLPLLLISKSMKALSLMVLFTE